MSPGILSNPLYRFRNTLDRVAAGSWGHDRSRALFKTLFSALMNRGVAVVVNFISVPLTVGYLGGERYGLWISISTMLSWFTLADLGLANALTNNLSRALAGNNESLAQQYVATTFWLLAGLSLALAGVFFGAWPWIDWRGLFNVHGSLARQEISPAVATAAILIIASLPVLINTKIFYACQQGPLANYWAAAGNVLSLSTVFLIVYLKLGLVWLILGVSGTTLAVSILTSFWLFGFHKPELKPLPSAINLSKIRGLGTIGGQFFVVQIAVLLIFQTDNLIITHFLGATQVTPYAVCFKLFSYATLLQALISPALWPAYSDAIARHDVAWVRRTFWLTSGGNLLVALIIVFPLMLFGRDLIKWWAGPAAVPTQTLLYWMAVWTLISSAMNSVACLLNGAGRAKGQSIYGTITALASVTLACFLVRNYGVVGVVAATVVAFLLLNCLPACLETAWLLRQLSNSNPGSQGGHTDPLRARA